METSSLHRSPSTTRRAMLDEHMDLHYHTPQRSIQSHLNPLAPPVGQRFLPDNYYEDGRKIKRGGMNEEKNGEGDEDELLFDIDDFLSNDEEGLFCETCETCENGNEGVAIVAESPANSVIRSTVEKSVFPDVASTNASVVNIQESSPAHNSPNIQKKKRKRKSRTKGKSGVDDLISPKRPLSAYNLYFREERKRCIAEASSSSTKKYNFEELGKIIGKGWRSLPLEEKRKLEARADADRERYRTEMIAYRNEKRRRAREEDQDSLILMKRHHQRRAQMTPCPHSPHAQHSSRSFTPNRLGEEYPYQQYVTISPGQQRDYPIQLGYPPNADPARKNHVRKVSLSVSSPPYVAGNSNKKAYRSVNNTSPTVLSYESCSSWSGDEGSDSVTRKRKPEATRGLDRSKERDGPGMMTSQGDTSNNSNALQENPLNISTNSVSKNSSSGTPPPEVPVARVVAMPATHTLQRMLEDGQASRSPPPQPYAYVSSVHHFYHHPPPPPQAYISSPSPEVSADRHRYSPPPNQQSSVVVGPPPPAHHLSSSSSPHAPQMLPLGMNILLRDPSTGQERSYRLQYAPQIMTAEQATQFHQSHGRVVGVDEKKKHPDEPVTVMV